MEKRLIIAIALSILIIVSFQYLSPKAPVPVRAPETAETKPPAQAKEAVVEKTAARPVDEKEFLSIYPLFSHPGIGINFIP